MKKSLCMLVSLVLTLTLFVGCSGNQQNAQTTGADTPKESTTKEVNQKAVKMTVWEYLQDNERVAFDGMLTKFNDSQKNYEVVSEYVPFTEMKKQVAVAVSAQTLPDLVQCDNPDHASLVSMGVFADITDKVASWSEKDKYFQGSWASTMYEGKNYGIPLDSNCLILFYNEDMLKAAAVEPPKTWDELKITAKKLTGNGVFGFGVVGLKGEDCTFSFMPWMASAGGSIDTLGSAETAKALSLYVELINDGSMSREMINWNDADLTKQFGAGKVAMMVAGPWNIPNLKNDFPDVKWNVALLPKDQVDASVLGGENIGIVAGKDIDAGWELLKFIGTPEVAKEYNFKAGFIPPRGDVASLPEWTDDPIMKVIVDQLQYAVPRGPSPQWPAISDAISNALQEALTLSKTPEQALAGAEEKVKALK